MSALTREVTARKVHFCGHCEREINKGERHLRWACPPWTEANMSAGWWSGRRHLDPDCWARDIETAPPRHLPGTVDDTCMFGTVPPLSTNDDGGYGAIG